MSCEKFADKESLIIAADKLVAAVALMTQLPPEIIRTLQLFALEFKNYAVVVACQKIPKISKCLNDSASLALGGLIGALSTEGDNSGNPPTLSAALQLQIFLDALVVCTCRLKHEGKEELLTVLKIISFLMATAAQVLVVIGTQITQAPISIPDIGGAIEALGNAALTFAASIPLLAETFVKVLSKDKTSHVTKDSLSGLQHSSHKTLSTIPCSELSAFVFAMNNLVFVFSQLVLSPLGSAVSPLEDIAKVFNGVRGSLNNLLSCFGCSKIECKSKCDKKCREIASSIIFAAQQFDLAITTFANSGVLTFTPTSVQAVNLSALPSML